MWLRHFLHKRRQKKFKAFRERYYEFRPTDTVVLCLWHHEEISKINYRIIAGRARRLGPCRDWRWSEAEALMKQLRSYCAGWMQIETPGVEPVHVGQGVSR